MRFQVLSQWANDEISNRLFPTSFSVVLLLATSSTFHHCLSLSALNDLRLLLKSNHFFSPWDTLFWKIHQNSRKRQGKRTQKKKELIKFNEAMK